jgi:Ser/Thr protein kinase RdoA (MazF antagonist)
MRAADPRPVHFRRLGGILARLHDHASMWTPPSGFVRMRRDWQTFFGNTMEYGGINPAFAADLDYSVGRASRSALTAAVGT